MPFPTIEPIHSARLTIRKLRESDVSDLFEINGDAEVTNFLPYNTWQSEADGVAWVKRMQEMATLGTGEQFVLELVAVRKVVGTLLMFQYNEASSRAELGYVLGRKYWRQGLMYEALSAFSAHAFQVMGLRRLEAEVNPSNHASNALLLNLGFAKEGTLRKRWVDKGVACDTNIYGLLSDEWPLCHAAAFLFREAARAAALAEN
jgi:[ribosomal protein S5]-alanine N-acetyltransferase